MPPTSRLRAFAVSLAHTLLVGNPGTRETGVGPSVPQKPRAYPETAKLNKFPKLKTSKVQECKNIYSII